MLVKEQLPGGYVAHRGLKREMVQFTCVRDDLLWDLRFLLSLEVNSGRMD